jgi:hypothetical protein
MNKTRKEEIATLIKQGKNPQAAYEATKKKSAKAATEKKAKPTVKKAKATKEA